MAVVNLPFLVSGGLEQTAKACLRQAYSLVRENLVRLTGANGVSSDAVG
jgi:hypothetical protein